MLVQILQLIMALGLLILLHEGGHFFFAKLFGVRVSRFYLFFNPKFHIVSTYDTWVRRLFGMKPTVVPEKDGKKEYVGTEYGIGWLPLGGYCAIEGMIDETNQELSEKPEEWEFRTKPVWQRLLIMLGGVLVNFLLALFIYAMILFAWGESYVPLRNMTNGMRFNAEAQQLGFHNGDILLTADGKELREYGADMFRTISEARDVEVLRDGATVHIALPGNLNLLDMIKSTPRFAAPLLPATVDTVMPGTPASTAGLQGGDLLVAINGHAIDSHNAFLDEITRLRDMMTEAKTPADSLKVRTVTLVYDRTVTADATATTADSASAATLTPATMVRRDTLTTVLTPELQLGFANMQMSAYKVETRHYGFFESLPAGVAYGWRVLTGYVDDMKYVFTADGAKSLGGFAAIGGLFPKQWDWHLFWFMTAFLSIILAFMNVLPIPALDGGHVLFLIYEWITGHTPSIRFQVIAEYVGFGIVLLLMIVANLNDLLRFLGYM